MSQNSLRWFQRIFLTYNIHDKSTLDDEEMVWNCQAVAWSNVNKVRRCKNNTCKDKRVNLWTWKSFCNFNCEISKYIDWPYETYEWVHRGDDLGVKFTVFLNINFNWHFTYKYKSYWVTRLLVSWICHGCCSIYFYMHLKYRYVYVTNVERKYTEQHLSGICFLH